MSRPTHTAAVDDLFKELTTFDGLDAFCLLPEKDQQRFVSWIVKARDDVSYWARIDAVALAMRLGPLEPSIRFEPAEVAESPQ